MCRKVTSYPTHRHGSSHGAAEPQESKVALLRREVCMDIYGCFADNVGLFCGNIDLFAVAEEFCNRPYVYIHAYMYTYIHIYVYIYICIHVYIYTCTYIYIYIYL